MRENIFSYRFPSEEKSDFDFFKQLLSKGIIITTEDVKEQMQCQAVLDRIGRRWASKKSYTSWIPMERNDGERVAYNILGNAICTESFYRNDPIYSNRVIMPWSDIAKLCNIEIVIYDEGEVIEEMTLSEVCKLLGKNIKIVKE